MSDEMPWVAAHFGTRNCSELSRNIFTGQSTVGGSGSIVKSRARIGNPTANLTWNDLDRAYSRVILGTVVLSIFEIIEERTHAVQTISGGRIR